MTSKTSEGMSSGRAARTEKEESLRSGDRAPVGIAASPYRPLSEPEVASIADAAHRVLAEGGVLVYSETAREALGSAGAEVASDGPLVKLPRGLVEDAIASNPSRITLHSRDGKCDAILEQDRVHYGTGGTAIYVLDPDTGQRRPSTTADVVLNARLVDTLEQVHVFTINVFPSEIAQTDQIDINRFFHALDNTTKHVMGGVYSFAGCREVVQLAELIAGSPDRLRAEPFVSFITLIVSPFKIDQLYGEMACYLAREGLPVVVPTEPICATTSPCTLAGNVLTHVAETLAGITMVQSVRRGAPGICGSVGSITNLRTLDHVGGAIERALINAAVAQMSHYFDLPLYSTGGTSDSKAMDVQAAYESAMSSLLVAMSGANYIHDIAGLLEADLTVAYDKLVVDNEILGMCQRVLRGIEVTDETLGTDLIIEKGPGGHFISEPHTLRHMRGEFFVPRLSNREKREAAAEGSDALSRARAWVERVRAEPRVSRLDAQLRQRILVTFPAIRDA